MAGLADILAGRILKAGADDPLPAAELRKRAAEARRQGRTFDAQQLDAQAKLAEATEQGTREAMPRPSVPAPAREATAVRRPSSEEWMRDPRNPLQRTEIRDAGPQTAREIREAELAAGRRELDVEAPRITAASARERMAAAGARLPLGGDRRAVDPVAAAEARSAVPTPGRAPASSAFEQRQALAAQLAIPERPEPTSGDIRRWAGLEGAVPEYGAPRPNEIRATPERAPAEEDAESAAFLARQARQRAAYLGHSNGDPEAIARLERLSGRLMEGARIRDEQRAVGNSRLLTEGVGGAAASLSLGAMDPLSGTRRAAERFAEDPVTSQDILNSGLVEGGQPIPRMPGEESGAERAAAFAGQLGGMMVGIAPQIAAERALASAIAQRLLDGGRTGQLAARATGRALPSRRLAEGMESSGARAATEWAIPGAVMDANLAAAEGRDPVAEAGLGLAAGAALGPLLEHGVPALGRQALRGARAGTRVAEDALASHAQQQATAARRAAAMARVGELRSQRPLAGLRAAEEGRTDAGSTEVPFTRPEPVREEMAPPRPVRPGQNAANAEAIATVLGSTVLGGAGAAAGAAMAEEGQAEGGALAGGMAGFAAGLAGPRALRGLAAAARNVPSIPPDQRLAGARAGRVGREGMVGAADEMPAERTPYEGRPEFYSIAERAVASSPAAKGNASHWMKVLQGAGVSRNEMETTGIERWLRSQPGQVTRAEVQRHLQENGLRVAETVYAEIPDPVAARRLAEVSDEMARMDAEVQPDMDRLHDLPAVAGRILRGEEEAPSPEVLEQLRAIQARAQAEIEAYDASNPRANARSMAQIVDDAQEEMVAVLDPELPARARAHAERMAPLHREFVELHQRNRPTSQHKQWTVPGGSNYREIVFSIPGAGTRDHHFPDVGGLLGWARTKDREIPGIGRSLHVEEVQSPPHQDARKRGYRGPDEPTTEAMRQRVSDAVEARRAAERESEAAFVSLRRWRTLQVVYQQNGGNLQGLAPDFRAQVEGLTQQDIDDRVVALTDAHNEAYARFEAAEAAEEAARQQIESVGSKVEDIPFKDNEWGALAMRRILAEAIEGEYDAISFNSGAGIARAVGASEEGLRAWMEEVLPNTLVKEARRAGVKLEIGKGDATGSAQRIDRSIDSDQLYELAQRLRDEGRAPEARAVSALADDVAGNYPDNLAGWLEVNNGPNGMARDPLLSQGIKIARGALDPAVQNVIIKITPEAKAQKGKLRLRIGAIGDIGARGARYVDDPDRVARELVAKADENGGFTVNPRTGDDAPGGFSVGMGRRGAQAVSATSASADAIRELLAKNGDAWSNPRVHIGGWKGSDGTYWFEPSEVFADRAAALRAAKEQFEDAVFDLNTFKTIYLKPWKHAEALARGDDPADNILAEPEYQINERVTGVAVKDREGNVHQGPNHQVLWDQLGEPRDPERDGFVTSTGRFVNRADGEDLLQHGAEDAGVLEPGEILTRSAFRSSQTGEVSEGSSHPAAFMAAKRAGHTGRTVDGEMGYVTSTGRFLTREEATRAVASSDDPRMQEAARRAGERGSQLRSEELNGALRNRRGAIGDQSQQSGLFIRGGKDGILKHLPPDQEPNTRLIGEALEARTLETTGRIDPKDQSDAAAEKIARLAVEELLSEMRDPSRSGAGWYGEKFQRALDQMARIFPELKGRSRKAKDARNLMTALIAITSDGQKVDPNFRMAIDIYDGWKKNGTFTTSRGHTRIESIEINLRNVDRLYKQLGPRKMHEYLMEERTVGELKKMAKAMGEKLNSDYQVHIRVPMAALIFGPKLGAFYANLMGAHGYLTMDRWWSRTFNRYRGTLVPAPSQTGMARFKELIGRPELDEAGVREAIVEPQAAYEAREFKTRLAQLVGRQEPTAKIAKAKWMAEARRKAGDDFEALHREHEIERAANTLHKAFNVELEDAPFGARDRTFMLKAANRAQELLQQQGITTTIADIQAILWYYEKRLYAELGAKRSADISYEETARNIADERLGNRPSGPAARGAGADATHPLGLSGEGDEAAPAAKPGLRNRRGSIGGGPPRRRDAPGRAYRAPVDDGRDARLLNLEKFGQDPTGEEYLRTVVMSMPDVLKRRVTWEETRKVASELGLDAKALLKVDRQMTSAELLAMRDIISQNVDRIGEVSELLARQGQATITDPVERARLQAEISQLEVVNEQYLRRFIKEREAAGRALNSLKIVARRNMDAATWLVQGQRIKGLPLTPEESATISKLVRAKDRAGLVQYVSGLRRSSASDKLLAIWKAGLLTGPPTHLANIGSNTAMAMMEAAKEVPAGLLDAVISLLRQKPRTKFVSMRGLTVESVGAAAEGFRAARRVFKTGIRPEDEGKWDVRRVTFTGPTGRFWQAYTDTVFNSLSAEDQVFRAVAIGRSLAEWSRLRARDEGLVRGTQQFGVRVEALMKSPPEDLLAKAILDAELAYFANANKLADAVAAFNRALPPSGQLAAGIVMPFVRTPTNVAARLFDYSPMGILSFGARVLKGGGQKRAVEDLGRVSIGSALVYLGMQLAAEGEATGAFPKDDPNERALWELEGKSPNSVKIGGWWANLGRLSPAGLLVSLGAQLHDLWAQEDKSKAENVLSSVFLPARVALDQTFLKGVSSSLNALNDPQRHGEGLAKSLAGSVVPAIGARVARGLDDVERTPDSPLQAIQARTPVQRRNVDPRVNVFGEETPIPGGNRAGRLMLALFDPFNLRKASTDPVVVELRRLGGEINYPMGQINDSTRSTGKRTRTDAEKRSYMRSAGPEMKAALSFIMSDSTYQSWSDPLKLQLVNTAEARLRREATQREQGKLVRSDPRQLALDVVGQVAENVLAEEEQAQVQDLVARLQDASDDELRAGLAGTGEVGMKAFNKISDLRMKRAAARAGVDTTDVFREAMRRRAIERVTRAQRDTGGAR